MKKNTKGAIALGAAALLLAGGAGTFAAWSDEASLGGGSVTSGELQIEQNGTGTWAWATPGGKTGNFDPTSVRIAPGDVITYTGNYDLTIVGTNLKASLTADLEGVEGDLAKYLDVGEATVLIGGTSVPVLTDANNGNTAQVTTTITFKGDTTDPDSMNASADLSGATVVLQQTAPAGPTP